jgi:hypothetical protein
MAASRADAAHSLWRPERWSETLPARDSAAVAGQYAVVGCEDAEPAVALIISVDIERGITLQVLDGAVEEHRHLLPSA